MSDSINALLQGSKAASLAQPDIQQVNPLAAISAGTQTAGQVFDLRAKQANQALGDAYRQAVDPATGRFDPLKFNQLMASNPITSFAAKGGIESSQALQGAQLEQNAKMQSLLNESITAALASPDANLKQSVLEQAARLRAAGFPSDRIDASLLHLSSDPAQLRQQLETVRVQSLPPDQRQQVIYGMPFRQTGPGGVTQGGLQDPRGGGVTAPPQAGMPTGMDAGQYAAYQQWLLAPVEYPDPANPAATKHGTRATMFQDLNVDPRQAWPGALQGAAAPRPAPTGGPSGFGPSPNKPGAAGAPATAPPVTRSFGAGTGVTAPSQADLQTQKASADQFAADNTAAGTYQQRIFPLVQAASILKSGDVTTGQGAEAFNRVKSFLMTQATNLGADAQTIQQADFDKVAKYLQQYVNMQGMSARSDSALSSAISGNPSAHISTLANQQILPVMIGMERMKQMILSDFKARGGQPAQYSNYASEWQNTHDPRAFIFDMMDNDQRAKMVASMNPTQRAMFNRTLDMVDRFPGIMSQPAMPGH